LALLIRPSFTNSGTPTSTTTSLSALSTTAIKDGHRGALHHLGHQHSSSTNSLEAERADRISRLTGLSTVSTQRGPNAGLSQYNAGSQTTRTSTGFPPNLAAAGLTPSYFDAAGQPVAANKVSTVGSASATSAATEIGGYQDTLGEGRDEDMLTEMDSASVSGYMGADAMDEDLDNLGEQSVGGFEDRMSDDGSVSLVGFGEGAGSTVSGPIYHRRPLPAQGPNQNPVAAGVWSLERSSSGLSEAAAPGAVASPNPLQPTPHSAGGRLSTPAARASEYDTGTDTPVSQSAVRERQQARMMDGVALDTNAAVSATGASPTAAMSTRVPAADDDDVFVDTTTCGPVPVPVQPTTSAVRETYPRAHRQATVAQAQHPTSPSAPSMREAAERIVHERLDGGEGRVGNTVLGSPPGGGDQLGKFYFEGR
jgi:hypothetical protein